jgi:RNA polymerase sigma factor (TIGR02999 family)
MGEQVSELLTRWSGGDASALDALTPMVYDELKRMGRRFLARRAPSPVLQPTVLVHEVWLKLATKDEVGATTRPYFLALAGKIMREILVDHFRRETAKRRGGSRVEVSLDERNLPAPAASIDILAVNDALDRLSAIKPRYAQIVELKFFAGLTIEESAAVLSVSHSTIEREWSFARIWLKRELRQ